MPDEFTAQFLGVGNVFQDQLEGVDGGVFHRVYGNGFIRKGRLFFPGFGHIHGPARQAVFFTEQREIGDKFFIIALYGREKSAGILDAVRGELF